MAIFNGTDGADSFSGDAENDTVTANGGNDSLNGNGGNDDIAGNAGTDFLIGGDGDDTIYSADRSAEFSFPSYFPYPYTPPILDTGLDADTLSGGAGDDRLFAGYGDTVDGGVNGYRGDYLYISFLGAPAGVTVDFRTATQTIGSGTITNVENVTWIQGSNYDDDIIVGSSSGHSDYVAVFGAGGNDHLVASYYVTLLYGDDGNDVLDGRHSAYLNRVVGGAGDDTLYTNSNTFAVADGGDGNDTIYAHGEVHGGGGNDRIELQVTYYTGNVFGDDGDDTIIAVPYGNYFNGNVIAGGNGADTLNGGALHDMLASADLTAVGALADDMGLEHDRLAGGGGDDALAIGYGDDADGGVGTDTLRLSLGGAMSGVTIDLSGITGGQPYLGAGGTIKNIELLDHLTGSAYADTITVGTQTMLLMIDGGDGDDIVISSNSSIEFNGGAGADRFVSGAAGDRFDGGDGFDTADYSQYASGITVKLGLAPGSKGSGPAGDVLLQIERVVGSAMGDTIAGSQSGDALDGGGGNDALAGDAGNDALDGGGGNDTMTGGSGNDYYLVDSTGDVIVEALNQGADVVGASVSYTLSANVEKLVLAGAADINGTGNGLANYIEGNSGANSLSGGGGADILNSKDGNDTLNGGTGADSLQGGNGNDLYIVDNVGDVVTEFFSNGAGGTDSTQSSVSYTLSLNVEKLVLTGSGPINGSGNAAANTITGNAGANSLSGLDGKDTLDGGAGIDSLTGGAGNDVFRFQAGQANGDSIADFHGNGASAGDSILLQGYGAGASVSVGAGILTITYFGGSDTIHLDTTGLDASDYGFV